MFEQLLADLLNKVLGDYVSNLERNQLNVGIWAGDVVLKNLRLRKEALEKFQLPIEVRDGFLGELTLLIPWKNLKNTPVQIKIKDVLLLAGPSDDSDYVFDAQVERERLHKVKQEQLESAELLSMQKLQAESDSTQQNQASFTEQLVTKIIDNLQISVSNIHICYEDNLSHPEHPFSVGLSIGGLYAVSTDENWQEKFISTARSTINKLIKLDALSVYWNTNVSPKMLAPGDSAGGNTAESVDRLRQMFADKNRAGADYLIRPVTALSRLTVRKHPVGQQPKYNMQLECAELAFELDDSQYTDGNFVAAYFSTLIRAREYRRWRPSRELTPKTHPREFWVFAIEAVRHKVHEKRYKNSWAYFQDRRDKRIEYKALWKRKRHVGAVPPGDQQRLDLLEMDLSVPDIRFFRSLADVEFRREHPEREEVAPGSQKKQQNGSWVGWLLGGVTAKVKDEPTAEQREFIRSTIEWDDSVLTATASQPDSVLILLEVKLETGAVRLLRNRHANDGAESVELELTKLSMQLMKRPDSQRVVVALSDLKCVDNFTEHSVHRTIVRAREDDAGSAVSIGGGGTSIASSVKRRDFFNLEFEAKPLDLHADYALNLWMRHAEIVIIPSLFKELSAFFAQRCSDPALEALKAAAGEKVSESLRGITKAGLQFALEAHRSVDVNIDIAAPILIVPESCAEEDGTVLLADLGHLTVTSDLVTREQKQSVEERINDIDAAELESLMYDKFRVGLQQLQIIIGRHSQSMSAATALSDDDRHENLYLLPRTNLTLVAESSILPNALNLAKTRIKGNLPDLTLCISDEKYWSLMRLAKLFSDLSPPDVDAAPVAAAADSALVQLLVAENMDVAPAGGEEDCSVQLHRSESRESAASTELLANAVKIMDRVLARLDFTADRVSVKVSRGSGELLLTCDLRTVNFSLEAKPFDMTLDCSVGAVGVCDETLKLPTAEPSSPAASHAVPRNKILDSRMDDGTTARLSLRQVRREHPDFLTTIRGVDRNLQVEFADIYVGVNNQSLATLYEFAMQTIKRGNVDMPAAPNANSSGDATDQAVGDSNDNISTTGSGVNMEMTFKLPLLTVQLDETDRPLASAAVKECTTVLKMNQDDTLSVDVKLGSIVVLNQRQYPDSVHWERFLVMEQQPKTDSNSATDDNQCFLDLTFQSYKRQLSTYPGYGSALKVRAGAVQLRFMEQFMTDLLQYVLFVAKIPKQVDYKISAVDNNNKTAKNAEPKEGPDAFADANDEDDEGAFMFDAEFDAPIVTIPRNDNSRDCLIFNLGHVLAKNKLVSAVAESDQSSSDHQSQVNTISVVIKDIGVASQMAASSSSSSSSSAKSTSSSSTGASTLCILKNATVELAVEIPDNSPTTKLWVNMPVANMELAAPQLTLTLDVVKFIADSPLLKTNTADVEALKKAKPGADNKDSGAMSVVTTTATTSAEPVQTMDATVVLNQAQLSLLDTRGRQFAAVILDGLNVSCGLFRDDSLKLQASADDIVLLDSSDSQTKFREIMPPSAAATGSEHKVVAVEFSTNAAKEAVVLVALTRPKLIVVPEYFFLLQQFGQIGFEQSLYGQSAPMSTAQQSAVTPMHSGGDVEKSSQQSAAKQPDSQQESPPIKFRVAITDLELLVLRDATLPQTDALALNITELVTARENILSFALHQLSCSLFNMHDRSATAVRIIEPLDVSMFLDARADPSSPVATKSDGTASIALTVPETIMCRISYRDILILTDIVQRISALATQAVQDHPAPKPKKEESSPSTAEAVYARAQSFVDQAKELNIPAGKEKCMVTVKGARLIIIDDLDKLQVPMFDALVEPFDVDLTDWSRSVKLSCKIPLQVGFYNITNSHWEPLLEPWSVSVALSRNPKTSEMEFLMSSDKKLDINVSHYLFNTINEAQRRISTADTARLPARDSDSAYVVRNLLGFPVMLWSGDSEPVSLADGATMPWTFEDWRKMREDLRTRTHSINVQVNGPSCESVKNIGIDRECRRVYPLHPRIDGVQHRIMCEVGLSGNVKTVTFRSCFRVENCTAVTVEVAVLDSNGHQVSTFSVPSGGFGALPLLSAHQHRFHVRPDGFGFGWSKKVYGWHDFTDGKQGTVTCESDADSADHFHLRLCPLADKKAVEFGDYPNLSLSILPPAELENLLPYDIKYSLFDKDSKQGHSGFLYQGQATPLYAVNPTHQIVLRIEIPDAGFGLSDAAIINNAAEFGVEDALVVRDEGGHELHLKMQSSLKMEGCDVRKVSIYAPYVIINKSGLDLEYKASSMAVFHRSAAGQMSQPRNQHPATSAESASVVTRPATIKPLMFSFLSSETLRGRIAVRSDDTEWSHSFSLDAVGRLSEVQMKVKSSVTAALGCHITSGTGKYCLSKVVTLTPRYMVKNRMGETLQVRLYQSDLCGEVEAKTTRPLLRVSESVEARLVQLRLPSIVDEWSAPVAFSSIGKSYVKLVDRAKKKEILVCVDVTVRDAIFVLAVSRVEPTGWPFRIDNESSVDVIVQQTHAAPRYQIVAGQSMLFAWDEPAYTEKLLTVQLGGHERQVNIQEIGQLVPFTYRHEGKKKNLAMSMDVVADGPTFVLKLGDWKQTSKSRFRKSRRAAEAAKGSEEDFEVVDVDAKVLFSARLKLSGIGVSMVDRHHRELIYASMRDVELAFSDATVYESLSASVAWIQVDNQEPEAADPIILYPTVIGREKDVEAHPAFKLALVRTKDQSYGVDCYKYFTCLLQEISLDLEEEFLYKLVDVFKFDTVGVDSDSACLWDNSPPITEVEGESEGGRMYFELFHIQPMKFNLSFYLSEKKKKTIGVQSAALNPLNYAVNVLSLALGNISDAPIRLHALIVENPIVTVSTMLSFIQQYYMQAALGQLHKVLGSADVLGNPVGLFSSIGSGVKDVFYEPYLGFVSDRPQDVGIGLAKGTASLLKKTVYGFSDTFSKFTGSVGKGLASATLDEEFQEQRKTSRARNKPRHATHGVAKGASSFAHSVVSGVTGIVEQPMRGAEKSGVGGFMKGLGKGLVGAVTKPIVGVFDLASNVTEGIKQATTAFDERELDRVRAPRVIGVDSVLKPYNEREATGASWLYEMDGGKHASEAYVAHLELQQERNVVFVTAKNVILAHYDHLDVEWCIPYKDIAQVRSINNGRSLMFERKYDKAQQTLVLPDGRSSKWLLGNIEQALAYYRSECC